MSRQKPKFLLLITQAEWGGAQRYVYDLAAGFMDDFSVTVAAGEPRGRSDLMERVAHAGVRTHRFKRLVRDIKLGADVAAVFELGRYFRREKFDVIHANASKSGVIASLACVLFGVRSRLIYTAHGWVFNEKIGALKRWLYITMEKVGALRRDATIVLSESEKKDALRYGLSPSKRLFVIPHGIDLSPDFFLSRDEARRRLSVESDEPIIGVIGNLYANKGYGVLVKAMQNIDARLVIVGETREDERRRLAARIDELGVGKKIIFAGAIADASRYLKAFDVFVISSVKEGLPYVLLEAMAAGAPIVATRVGAIPEVLENKKTGLLVQPADSTALHDGIKTLLADRTLSSELATAARATVTKRYRLDEQLKKTHDVYATKRCRGGL